MRKQYRFWPSDAGLQAWDVDRLIELTATLTPKRVRVDSVREIDAVQFVEDPPPDYVGRKPSELPH